MTKKDEAAQAAAEAEAEAAEAARIAEGEANPAQPGDPDHAAPTEEEPELEEEDVDEYPLLVIEPGMTEGGDWQSYRPSLTFRAKVMPERFSVETKDGLVTGEPGDVLAVMAEDEVWVFSSSVFAAEYQPVVHGA